MSNELKKYLLADHSTRIQAVHLTTAWQTGLEHQQHLPVAVQTLLGELVAAATLLAANLKFDGSLVLQLQGQGPVALLVVECSSSLQIRATASLRDDAPLPENADLQNLLNQNNAGRFVVILDPKDNTGKFQPYQGIIPLEGDSVAEVLQNYMYTSEQLETRLWLAANNTVSAGVLLQRLPDAGGKTPGSDPEEIRQAHAQSWEEMLHLFQTIKHNELIENNSETLLHKLLWQHDLIALPGQGVSWHCPCNRERVADMLRMLGSTEVDSILSEKGQIDVACNFCGKPYQFDAIDAAQLFLPASEQNTLSNTVH